MGVHKFVAEMQQKLQQYAVTTDSLLNEIHQQYIHNCQLKDKLEAIKDQTASLNKHINGL